MAGENDLTRDVDVDLGGIFAGIWRNKGRILLAALIVTVLAFFLLQVISPRYKSEARILIRTSDPVLTGPVATNRPAQTDMDDQGIASQVQLLQSQTIARKVIEKLKLKEKAEFDPALKRSPVDNIMGLLGLSDDPRGVTAEDRVLETFLKRLKVFQAERSRVVVVQFWSKEPKLAADIANAVSDEYFALQEELKRGAAPSELKALEPEIEALRKKVVEAEAAVADFRASSDLLAGRNNQSLATQELSELSTELGRVRAQLSRTRANANAVSRALSSGSLDTATAVIQSPLIQRLRERQVTLNAQLAEISTTLLPAHPRVQRLRSQLLTLTRQISTEARKIQRSLQQEARVAQSREQDLVQRRNQLKSEAGRVERAQVQLRSLQREADAQRQLLNSFLVRFKEATSRQNREFLPADAYVFAKAQAQSKPYFPKKGPILAGAFFGTTLLGSLIALATSMFAGPPTAPAQTMPARPVAAREPQLEGDLYASAAQSEVPNASQSSRAAAAAMMAQRQMPDGLPDGLAAGMADGVVQDPRSGPMPSSAPTSAPPLAPTMADVADPIAASRGPVSNVVSANGAAQALALAGGGRVAVLALDANGRSETGLAIARDLAGRASRVLFADMTGRGLPTIAIFGDKTKPGIKDALAGASSLADCIHRDPGSSMHVVPCGRVSTEMGQQAASSLGTVLATLGEAYEFVVIDCGATSLSGLERVCNPSTAIVVDVPNPQNAALAATKDTLI
ncbi:MAG: Wzz/FepE/Etk N-terminal domain-containing protein, partial [Pseudomonadota bacterium]